MEELQRQTQLAQDWQRRAIEAEETLRLVRAQKCPTCADFQIHFLNMKGLIRSQARTINALRRVIPRRADILVEQGKIIDRLKGELADHVIVGLRAVQDKYRGRGGCKWLSKGGTCHCPLCILDAAMALVERA